MSLVPLTPAELALETGLWDESGALRMRGVADLVRAPLARWGLSPRRAVLGHARRHLRASGIEDVAPVEAVLRRLRDLGELEEVSSGGGEVYLAPAEPRWISTGAGLGTYLGVTSPPEGVAWAPAGGPEDLVQRIRVETEDEAALLQAAGVREMSMAEWLSPPGYLRHAARRAGRAVRHDRDTLASFWDLLEGALVTEGLPVGADAELRAVTGAPGGFFGHHETPRPEGRWTESIPDGTWCAYRRGFGDAHWHPIVVAVEDTQRRMLDLFDHDEWLWALLARSRRCGPPEVVERSGDSVRLTFPPPRQLAAAMDLLGPRSIWIWAVPPDAPDPWGAIR